MSRRTVLRQEQFNFETLAKQAQENVHQVVSAFSLSPLLSKFKDNKPLLFFILLIGLPFISILAIFYFNMLVYSVGMAFLLLLPHFAPGPLSKSILLLHLITTFLLYPDVDLSAYTFRMLSIIHCMFNIHPRAIEKVCYVARSADFLWNYFVILVSSAMTVAAQSHIFGFEDFIESDSQHFNFPMRFARKVFPIAVWSWTFNLAIKSSFYFQVGNILPSDTKVAKIVTVYFTFFFPVVNVYWNAGYECFIIGYLTYLFEGSMYYSISPDNKGTSFTLQLFEKIRTRVPERLRCIQAPLFLHYLTYPLDRRAIGDMHPDYIYSSFPIVALSIAARKGKSLQERNKAVALLLQHLKTRQFRELAIHCNAPEAVISNLLENFDKLKSSSNSTADSNSSDTAATSSSQDVSAEETQTAVSVTCLACLLLTVPQATQRLASQPSLPRKQLIEVLSRVVYEGDNADKSPKAWQLHAARLLVVLSTHQAFSRELSLHATKFFDCLELRFTNLHCLAPAFADQLIQIINCIVENRIQVAASSSQTTIMQHEELISVASIYHTILRLHLFRDSSTLLLGENTLQGLCQLLKIPNILSQIPRLGNAALSDASVILHAAEQFIESPNPDAIPKAVSFMFGNIYGLCLRVIRSLIEIQPGYRNNVRESFVIKMNQILTSERYLRYPVIITQIRLTLPVLLGREEAAETTTSSSTSSARKKYYDTVEFSTSTTDMEDTCPVCLEEFQEAEKIAKLQVCKHVFHVNCVDIWFMKHQNCPMCRAKVVTP